MKTDRLAVEFHYHANAAITGQAAHFHNRRGESRPIPACRRERSTIFLMTAESSTIKARMLAIYAPHDCANDCKGRTGNPLLPGDAAGLRKLLMTSAGGRRPLIKGQGVVLLCLRLQIFCRRHAKQQVERCDVAVEPRPEIVFAMSEGAGARFGLLGVADDGAPHLPCRLALLNANGLAPQ